MDWELYRNSDGTLDLESIIVDRSVTKSNTLVHALDFIRSITILQKISSRQVAALAIISAESYADSVVNK